MALVQRTNTANIVHTPNHVILFQGNEIESTVTNSAAVIEDWLSQIYSCLHNGTRIIVGLDCKHKSSYFSKSEVLQLCVDRKCLVIQLCHLDIIPQTLLDFVRDPNILFVGVGVSNLVRRLNEYNKLDCSSAIEAYKLANHSYSSSLLSKCGYDPCLTNLATHVLGSPWVVEKPVFVTESNWGTSVLSVEQIRYASIDAYVIYRIGRAPLSKNI